MAVNVKNKSLLTVADWKTEEVRYVLKQSKLLKDLKYAGTPHKWLEGKNVVLVMNKPSTRTRSAFEVAAFDLGMGITFFGGTGQMGVKESIEDTAKVYGGMYDGIALRGKGQEEVEILAEFSGVPVWNALTDQWHPTQMFADYLTVLEHNGRTDVKFVYFGDARNNMGNSLMVMTAHMGGHFVAVAPKALWPEASVVKKAKEIAKKTGAIIEMTEDPMVGSKDADVIYTDVWVSMGEPNDVWATRIKELKNYQVNSKVMDNAGEDAIFLHCLPAFHDLDTQVAQDQAALAKKNGLDLNKGMEVSDEVFRSDKSKVFEQAENRMHTIKAIMYETLK